MPARTVDLSSEADESATEMAPPYGPASRAKIGGWVHDFTPMSGISFGF
jgi:hypothetical protein